MPKFSVIIPVHNGEKTLSRCLASLQAQSEADFEVLLMENGSQDRSVEICRKWSEQDTRFQFYTLGPCDGPSYGRNQGLERATGEYIAFIDCDDYVEPFYLECLLDAFGREQADVAFMGYHHVHLDGRALGEHIPQESGADYYGMLAELYAGDLFGYTWIKAFRRSAIGSYRFREDLNLLEDEIFACQVLAEKKRIAVVPRALYYYVTGSNDSLMGRTHPDFCRKCDVAFRQLTELFAPWEGRRAFLEKIANQFVGRCRYYGFERPVEWKQFCTELAQSSYFAACTLDDSFGRAIRQGQYAALRLQRERYRMKNKLYHMLKK